MAAPDARGKCSTRGSTRAHMGAMPPAGTAPPPRPVERSPRRSWAFLIANGLAQTGAFITFIPLLTLLLPLKAQAIAGADKAVLLSQVSIFSGLTAAGANLLFGALSDGTRSRWGRRRPWLICGWLMTAVALVLIQTSTSVLWLIAAIVLFQLSVNAMFAPMVALIPDLVPDSQKGVASAIAGVALPASNLFTASVAALAWLSDGRYLLVIAASALLVLPFALRLKEPAGPVSEPDPVRPGFRFSAFASLAHRDFRGAFVARAFMEAAIALNTLYLLYLVQHRIASGAVLPDLSSQSLLAVLLAAGTAASVSAGFGGGLLSDRLGRRRPVVMTGGMLIALGGATMVVAPDWPGPLIGQILFGLGHGLFSASAFAMIAQLLPDPRTRGRDLGVMNLATACAQAFGPMVGLALLNAGYSVVAVFVLVALAAAAGALSLFMVKRGA